MADTRIAADTELSVVIPIYNEEAGLAELFARLYPALDALGIPYEILFVDDGSHDGSAAMLRDQYQQRPDVTRVILLQSNFGQHAAILAGFSRVRGQRIVTLDADLQNPPEEIAALLRAMDEGYDYVGTIRRRRRDALWRKWASRLMNRMRERMTHIHMTDQGCMLRAYSREIVDAINSTSEINTFIPALAYLYAAHPTEVMVEHNERHAGESKYSLLRLIRLNFDLVTDRLLGGAATDFLPCGRLCCPGFTGTFRVADGRPHPLRAGCRRCVHPVRHRVLLYRRAAGRYRHPGRIRRAHLSGSATTAAFRDPRHTGRQKPR